MSKCFRLGIHLLLLLQITVIYSATAWSAASEQDDPGCTPGYWRQYRHIASWPVPLTPVQKFQEVFGTYAFPEKTLLEVLGERGGQLQALGRHAVAALLNVRTVLTGADSDFVASQLIASFASAFPGNDDDREMVKNYFERFNEQDCPAGTFVWRFDFGTESSPVQYGYLRGSCMAVRLGIVQLTGINCETALPSSIKWYL